jgi:hypothetical protein
MAFEITDLMIQVVTGSPEAAAEPATRCQVVLTCKPEHPAPPTKCQDAVTCKQEVATKCETTLTCVGKKKGSAELELDAVLAQLRATV